MPAPSAVVAASASPTLFSRRPTWKTKRVASSSSNKNIIRHANSARNIIRAAASNDNNPNDALPQALFEAAAKKLAGFAAMFGEDTPTHPRPPTLPMVGNLMEFIEGRGLHSSTFQLNLSRF